MVLEFIVVEARIEARNSGARLENPVSINECRYKLQQRETWPFYY